MRPSSSTGLCAASVGSSSYMSSVSRRSGIRSLLVDRRRQLPAVVLDELEAEAALDAEVAVRDRVVERRRDLDDRVVLLVQHEVAAHAAVRADRLRLRLALGLPPALVAHVELALEAQRAR